MQVNRLGEMHVSPVFISANAIMIIMKQLEEKS